MAGERLEAHGPLLTLHSSTCASAKGPSPAPSSADTTVGVGKLDFSRSFNFFPYKTKVKRFLTSCKSKER